MTQVNENDDESLRLWLLNCVDLHASAASGFSRMIAENAESASVLAWHGAGLARRSECARYARLALDGAAAFGGLRAATLRLVEDAESRLIRLNYEHSSTDGVSNAVHLAMARGALEFVTSARAFVGVAACETAKGG